METVVKRSLVLCLAVLALGRGVYAQEDPWEEIGRGISDVRTVIVGPGNPDVIYVGSSDGIFMTQDSGGSWRSILSAKGSSGKVNFLYFHPFEENTIYAGTENGLFYSRDRGRNWKKAFAGKNPLESYCTSVAVTPDGIYLGTKGGLFISQDSRRNWLRAEDGLGRAYIMCFAYDHQKGSGLFVASEEGVFIKAGQGRNFRRVFSVNHAQDFDDPQEIPEEKDEEADTPRIRFMAVDPNDPGRIYLASKAGIFVSKNSAESWEAFETYGLLSKEVDFLLFSPQGDLYAVAGRGIFEYNGQRWQELFLGLTAQDIRSLALDSRNNLYAACDNGLFRMKFSGSSLKNMGVALQMYTENEPTIKEVQEAAIRYAEVEPEKIRLWRIQASRKAWLPQVSLGLNRNVTDLWHWEGGSTTRTDDDTLRRGRDSVEWDVSLSWDLGEIVWNNDQTSIDVRSRLTSQLRDDVLDAATKLYFERLRLKMEIDSLSLTDKKKRLEKELKLQEATASLDGLTGGYFSRCLVSS